MQHLRTETGLANKFTPAKEFGVPSPPTRVLHHPDQAKALLKQPDGALVSVRTWDEFVGNTSGYSYIKPQQGDIPPDGPVGSTQQAGGVDANSMSGGWYFHNPDGTMKPAQIQSPCGMSGHRADPAGRLLLRLPAGARLRGLLLRLADGLEAISVYDGGWFEAAGAGAWIRQPHRHRRAQASGLMRTATAPT